MSDPTIGIIFFGLLMLLVLLRMPIAFAMALTGFTGLAIILGVEGALSSMRLIPPQFIASYELAVLPLFLFMGILVSNTGISKDLYTTGYMWVGQFRGGIAMATVLACGGFAAISGSSTASVVTMGKIVKPEALRFNYEPKLAAGSVAAGGTLGMMIPPSMAFIMYAMLTETSVGRLFMAGILPGITAIIFYIVVIIILCKIRPEMGPAGPSTSFVEKLVSLKGSWGVGLLFVLVMGGIYSGIFTPTEAAAVGVFGTIVMALIMRRLSWTKFTASLDEAGRLTAMIMLLFLGAMIFSRFMSVSRIPFLLADIIANLHMPTYGIIAMILLTYVILGCVFDVVASMVITIPILFPVIVSLGLDPIWYGVIMVKMLEIGLITPPIGINSFMLAAAMNYRVGTVFSGIVPFLIGDIFLISLLVAVPQISIFLPNMMIGK